MTSVLLLMLVLAVSAGNFAIGFGLAVYFGQGPELRRWLGKPRAATTESAAKAAPAAH